MILGISLLIIGFLLAIFVYVYVALEGARRTIEAAPWPVARPYDGEAEAIWSELWEWREVNRARS